MPSSRLFAACLSLLLPAGTLPAQGVPPTGAFIVTLGADTISVERYTRVGDSYNVEQVLRSPRTSWRHTHLQLTPSGDIASVYVMVHRIGAAADAPLLASTKLTPRAGVDSASVEMTTGDSTRSRTVAMRRGLVPTLAQSFFAYELAAMRMRAAGADSMVATTVTAGGDTLHVMVHRLGTDSMTFRLPFLTYRAQVDAEGRILSLYQPLGTAVKRVDNVDVDGLAHAWSALDASGKGMGALSPLDSLTARIGMATLAVRYSRPRARGRVIFGRIVPLNAVWRTGANAATVFTTDRDVMIGKLLVPAGSYTLFTLPTRTGTTLIVSKETMREGEPLAGTDYDAKHDLGRVRMTTRTLKAPVEQFTIAIAPRGPRTGELRFAWDKRQMTVPIRVR